MSTLEFAEFTVQTLAPGVHGVIAKQGTGSIGNSGIIDLGDRTLVFDTFMCVPAARELQRAAIALTGRPATYVVNSHPHPDHVHGNIAFGDDAVIVSSNRTRAELVSGGVQSLAEMRQQFTGGLRMMAAQAEGATDELQRQRAQGAVGFFRGVLSGLPEAADLRYPSITFEQRLTLHGSARSVELMALGGGHSPCDSVLWLPAERIAFTADVVISGGHPVMKDGDPEAWLQILDEVDKLGAVTLMPGHGRVQTAAATGPVREYIQEILALAKRVAGEGITPETVAQVPVPEAYRGLVYPQVFYENLATLLRRMG
jgi:cyclase